MTLSDAEFIEPLSDILGDDLISALVEVRRDMLEPLEQVTHSFAQLSMVLNVDPVRCAGYGNAFVSSTRLILSVAVA